MYRIRIQDQGPGIPPESLPRIFDRFFRLDEYRPEGTGLGLAIAQAIVENHHGKIQVKSNPPEGTTFTVWLPSRH
jgi:signal transduction histidine kinase